ncbi:hypothetical protein [Schaalia meyeri]
MKSLISGLIDAAIGFFFEAGRKPTNLRRERMLPPTRRSSHAGPPLGP